MSGLGSIYLRWKVLNIRSNVGGACSETLTLEDEYEEKLLNALGTSLGLPVLLHTSPALKPTILIPVLDSAVDMQNFEYKMSSIVDKALYILLRSLLSRAFDASTDILRSRTTLVARVRCRSTYILCETMVHPSLCGSLSKRPWHCIGVDVIAPNYLTGNCVYEKRM